MSSRSEEKAIACGTAIAGFGLWFLQAWLVMLLFGVWHDMRDAVPPIAYWEAFVACAIVDISVMRLGGSK